MEWSAVCQMFVKSRSFNIRLRRKNVKMRTYVKSLVTGGLMVTLAAFSAVAQSDPRTSAVAAWYFGDGIAGETNPITSSGTISYNIVPTGCGARPANRTAQLIAAHFNAGTNLGVSGNQLTVFLRARVPGGSWSSGLFAKRGSTNTLNYNLFGGTTGTNIGFELRTVNGFVSLSFPVSNLDATAWHNLVGRYDGTNAQLFCNYRLMASAPLTGNLIQNAEPTLIGAETDNGSIVRPFTGFIEEAALWNTALNDTQLAYLNNLTATNDAYPTQLLHYRHPDHDVGDVHIRYINGSWVLTYMYLVGTNYFQAELTTLDFLHWTWRNPVHASVSYPDVLPTWFAIESFWDPYLSKWRSVWGYAGMRSSLSDDRFNWYAASPQTLLSDPGGYRRFSDPAITQVGTNAWQMVITMAKTNLSWETGGSIGYATSSNLTQWSFQGDLFFPGNRGVPEVPTLFQMGSKWYLLSSWYSGGVGRPTYQVADSPTGPWSEFTPNSLDGKDVSAATSDAYGTNRILSGWIPLYAWNTSGQHWGGHLCFPREIFQLTNGALRSRLPVHFGDRIRGSQLFPGLVNPSAKSGNWVYQNLGAQMDCYSGSGQNRTILPGLFDRFEADMTFTPNTGTKRVGWLMNWQESGSFFEVGLNQTNQTLFIRTADGTIHADLSVPVTLNAQHRLRVIVEEDMAEVVYDDQFTLAARIPTKLRTTSLGLFTEGGPVNFSSVAVNRLNNLAAIPAPTTTTVVSSGNNSTYGTTVTFTATVTPSVGGPPTGTVAFTIDGVPQSPVPVTPSGLNGIASISTASLSVNVGIAHTVTAQYTGSDFFDATGGVLNGGQTVSPKILKVTGLTASDKVYDGTTMATLGGAAALLPPEPPGNGTASDGRPYTGDEVILGGTPVGTFATKGVANGIPVTVSGNSISGAQMGNYTLTQQAGLSANITPIAIINVPAGQPNIIAAVAAASAGYEIRIATGVYIEANMVSVPVDLAFTASGGPVTIRVPTSVDAVANVVANVTGAVFDGIKFERVTANNDWMRSVQMNSSSAAMFNNCTFTGPGNGVGVILFSGADATFNSCAFSNFNATATWAAAIFMQNQGTGYSDVVLRNSTFDTGCNGWIKAFDNNLNWPKVGELTVSNCTFKAARYLQALKFRDGGSFAMQYDPSKALLFQDCTFEGTTLEIAEFHYTNGSRPTSLKFSRCQFKAYNSTRKMFWFDLPTPIVFENCLFAGGQHQTIMTVWGGPPSVDFYHCTVINDGLVGTPSQSSFIDGYDYGRTFNIVNCLFRCPVNYTAGFVGDAGSSANRNYAVCYSVIDHATPVGAKTQITSGAGYSNTSLASAFINAASRNYHLTNGAPWVNGGVDLAYLFDLDRNSRNQGTAPDMGAYELYVAPAAPPVISVACNAGNVVVSFTGVLQSSENAQGPFTDVPTAVSPITAAPTNSNKFWRSRSP